MSEKKRPANAFPEETWRAIEVEYRTTKTSPSDIIKKYGVSNSAFYKVARQKGWKRGDMLKEAKELAKDKMLGALVDEFVKQGMPPQTVVVKVIDGMNFGENLTRRVVEVMNQAESAESLNPALIEDMRRVIDDLQVRLRYIQEYNKMCGLYPKDPAGPGVAVSGGTVLILPDNGRVNQVDVENGD